MENIKNIVIPASCLTSSSNTVYKSKKCVITVLFLDLTAS